MKIVPSRGNPKRAFLVLSILTVVILVLLSSFIGYAYNTGSRDGTAKGLATTPHVNESFANTSGYRNTGYSGDSAIKSNGPDIILGNVSGSYLQDVFIPVYLDNGSSFTSLLQLFSFDPSLLRFIGIIDDVSSQNVTFTSVNLTGGMVKVYGNGTFLALPYRTTLYYLEFLPEMAEQVSTMVLLDYSVLGGTFKNSTSSSSVELARGWTTYGPNTVPATMVWYGGAYMSTNGTGFTNAIAFSPYFPNIIYEGSGTPGNWGESWGYGGIMKSTDGGMSWKQVDLGINFTSIQYIWVDPLNPSTVVAIGEEWGTTGGIFKTVNGGLSWQETYSGNGDNLQFVTNRGLYAFMEHSVLLSTDFGSRWVNVSSTSSVIDYGMALDNGSKIVLAEDDLNAGSMKIFVSNNGGSSYNAGSQSFTIPNVLDLIADPSNSSIQWMMHLAGYNNNSIFKSVDGGMIWESVNYTSLGMTSFTDPNYCPQVIAYDPGNSSIMYIGGEVYVAKSVNGGNSFTELTNIVTSPYRIVVDPLNDNNIYVGGEQGIFVSHDGGSTWESVNNRSSTVTQGISVDGNNSLVTLSNFGPVVSDNNGTSWSDLSPRPHGLDNSTLRFEGGVTTVDPYNNSIVLFAAGGMLVSHNGGLSYTMPEIDQIGVDNNPVSEMHSFVFVPNSSVIFYAGNAGIYASKDNGYSWTVLQSSPKNCVAITGNIVTGEFSLYASNSSGLFYSDDEGLAWTLINKDHLATISTNPDNPSIISGTISTGIMTEVVLSHDSGRNFTYDNKSSTGLGVISYPGVEYQQLSNGTVILYFVSTDGVFASLNDGTSWKNVSYNLPTCALISMEIYGNTCYMTTQGSGVLYDPSLSNFTFYKDRPIVSGYLPSGASATIEGTLITGPGYFSVEVSSGNNSIGWNGKELNLLTFNGGIYFLNFSNIQVFLTANENNLPTGTEWNISANGKDYNVIGNETIALPPGTSGVYVLPVATDYSIYYPSKNFYTLNSSLTSSITVQFSQTVKAIYSNITSFRNGMFWSTQIAYNRGYVLYAGGTLGLLNVTSNEGTILNIPDYAGQADTVTPFGDGFLVAGSASPNRPGIYYYNISTGIFTNYSTFLPATWEASDSVISSIFEMNSSAFGFIGGGIDSAYFGMVNGEGFINLTPYLPSPFTPSNEWYDRYSGAYLSSYRDFVLSDGTDVGIFYLQNKSFHDISPLMPNGFFVGMPGNEWSPSSDFISSNDSTAIITGRANMGQFTVLFSPDKGIRDISDLFPSSEYMDTVTSQGRDIVLSGHETNGNSSSIFVYNTTRQIPTAINTTYYGNTSLIDSAIMVGNSVYFTTFNVKLVPNQSYVILSSYYGAVKLTPTGCVKLKVSTLSTIEINNETYYAMNASIPEFAGNYTLKVSSPGFVSYASSVDLLPFENLYLNVTIEPISYGVTFTENGLPSGVFWSMTLNGTTESSMSGSITFREPNGTYPFSVVNVIGYNVVPASGNIVVNGKPAKESISFTQITQEGYFVGSVSPPNATISILVNGSWVSYKEDNGSFNISLIPGTYRVSISAPRYTTYATNITVSSSTVTSLSIHSLSKVSGPSSFPVLLLVIAIVIIVAFAVAAVALVRFRKRT